MSSSQLVLFFSPHNLFNLYQAEEIQGEGSYLICYLFWTICQLPFSSPFCPVVISLPLYLLSFHISCVWCSTEASVTSPTCSTLSLAAWVSLFSLHIFIEVLGQATERPRNFCPVLVVTIPPNKELVKKWTSNKKN